MSEPKNPQQPPVPESTLRGSRVLVLIAGIALAVVALWTFASMRAQRQRSDDALAQVISENEELQKRVANLQVTVADVKVAELRAREQQTLAKDGISVILERTTQIEKTIYQLAEAQARWKNMIDDLKGNQVGKQIASDAALVDLLATIVSTAPNDMLSDGLSGRLRPIVQDLHAALAEESVSFKPSEAFLTRIDEIEDSASTASQWYRDHLLQLDALSQQAANFLPAERSLGEAIQSRDAERAQERVNTLAARNREIQRQHDETIGAAELEAQRIIDEAEAQAKRLVGKATAANITQAALAEKAKQEEAIRKRRAAEKLAQLKREFQRDLPDIKVKLQPFISAGYTYNGDTGRQGPVSLSVLRGRGALESGRKGLEKLLYVGGTTTNDRQRGAFPQYVGGEYAWRQLNKDFVAKAQEYLNKYGDLLIEADLLVK